MELRIDPDFERRIPALTPDEFQQLEQNIIADGLVINPIIVWNGVIVDGHNRFHIVEKHPSIRYTTHEMQFADRGEAIAWIYKNQLGRRNLTPEQKRYLIGKQFEAEKQRQGSNNQYVQGKSEKCQRGTLQTQKDTARKIADENGIGRRSVFRAESYAKAVDIAEEVEPGIRSELLSGSIKTTANDIQALAKAAPEERAAIVAALRKPPREKSKLKKPLTEMQQIGNDMLTRHGEPTAEDMLCELKAALESLMFRWTFSIDNHLIFYKDDVSRSQINELAREGITYLQKIMEGEMQS